VETIGRAKTVLVFDDTAVISSIIAHENDSDSTSFLGQVSFSDNERKHINEIIVPIVHNILQYLGLPGKSFNISIVNLSVASMMGMGMNISGFSADVPLFLALLSSALDLPIPDDIVSTGHIASIEGDIKPVQKIPEKITAVIADSDANKFIYPDLDSDISLDALSPSAKQETEDAIINAKAKIRAIPVKNIAELLETAIPDEAIVLSSMAKGYFNLQKPPNIHGNQALKCARILTENNQNRFWTVVDRNLFAEDDRKAKHLLLEFVRFHIQKEMYPAQFGYKLKQIISSLPSSTKRLKIRFPLIPMEDCISLTQFASKSDHDDISELYSVVNGKNFDNRKSLSMQKQENETNTLKNILSEIDETALAEISKPIDEARSRFILDKIIVESHEEFNDIISSFYVHLLCNTNTLSSPVNIKDALSDALDLLEKAFSDRGGDNTARAEAKSGIHGGLRFVIDIMTNHYKIDKQEKHINMVIKESIDSLDATEKKNFIKEFMEYIGPHMPEDIRSQPPERYIRHYDEIVRLYVQSMDKVKQYLSRL